MSGVRDMFGRIAGAARQAVDGAGGFTLLELSEFGTGGNRFVLEAAMRARCQTVTIDPHTVLCRILGRFKFLVDSRDIGLAPHLMLDGYWEFWATEFIARTLRPGQVAWDVGANLGYYAVLMSAIVGPQGKVRAVEPNPRLALLCGRNLSLNGFWDRSSVHRQAVADRSGQTLRFRADITDPKNGRLLPPGTPPQVEQDDVLEVAVQTVSLDDLAEERVDFIKIDVEGAEEQVWAGMQRMLDRNPGLRADGVQRAACVDAPGTLAQIARRFPLRELGYDAQLHEVTPETIMGRQEDTLLVLANRAL